MAALTNSFLNPTEEHLKLYYTWLGRFHSFEPNQASTDRELRAKYLAHREKTIEEINYIIGETRPPRIYLDWCEYYKNYYSHQANNTTHHTNSGQKVQIYQESSYSNKTDNTPNSSSNTSYTNTEKQTESDSVSRSSETSNVIEKLRQDLSEANSRANQFESTKNSLERKVKELENQYHNLERRYNQEQDNHKDTMGQSSSNDKKYEQQIKAAKKKYEDEIYSLGSRLRTSEQQTDDKQRENQRQSKKFEKMIGSLQSDIKSLEDKLNNSDKHVRELEDKLKTVVADKDRVQTDYNYSQTQLRLGLEAAKKLVNRQGASKYAEESSMQIYVSIPRGHEDVVSSILTELGYDKCNTVVSSPEDVPDSAKLHLYFSFLSTNRVTDDIINGFKSFQGKSSNQVFVPISCAAKAKKITERELRKKWNLDQHATMPQVLFNRKEKTVRRESLGDLRSTINQVFGLHDAAASNSSQESLVDILARVR